MLLIKSCHDIDFSWGNYTRHKFAYSINEQRYQKPMQVVPEKIVVFPKWSSSLFISFCVALYYFINFDIEDRFHTNINKYNKNTRQN